MDFLVDIHSYLRWAVLALLAISVIVGFASKGDYSQGVHRLYLSTMMFVNIQVLIGFVLYFANQSYQGFQHMDDTVLRFYALEHPFGMIVATGLISVGWGRAKRSAEAAQKHKKVAIFYLLGLIVIFASIPWPFRLAA